MQQTNPANYMNLEVAAESPSMIAGPPVSRTEWEARMMERISALEAHLFAVGVISPVEHRKLRLRFRGELDHLISTATSKCERE